MTRRNFGIPNVTARSAPGAQLPNGPHSRAGRRDLFTTERINPDDYELGGWSIFLIVVVGSAAIVLGLVMAYMVSF